MSGKFHKMVRQFCKLFPEIDYKEFKNTVLHRLTKEEIARMKQIVKENKWANLS